MTEVANIDPAYIVAALVAAIYALVEGLKYRDKKKSGESCTFTDEDQDKLEHLHKQHAPLDAEGRPIWYSNQRELGEHTKKLDTMIDIQQRTLTELKTMNVTLGKWKCPIAK